MCNESAMAAYGWDYFQIGYSAGRKAARILKGEKPGDIPWDLGERLILMINEKAAKAQGAIVAPELLKKRIRSSRIRMAKLLGHEVNKSLAVEYLIM